jgi:hypothetical protein
VTPSALGGPDASLASPGTLTFANDVTFAAGGNYRWYTSSVFDGAYTSSKLSSVGELNLNGLSSANRFTILIDSLSATNADGNVYDFNQTVETSWVIGTFNGGISGFAEDKFVLDVTGFTNTFEPGWGFLISQVGNDLVLTYAPIPEPGLLLGVAGLGLAGVRVIRRRRQVAVTA